MFTPLKAEWAGLCLAGVCPTASLWLTWTLTLLAFGLGVDPTLAAAARAPLFLLSTETAFVCGRAKANAAPASAAFRSEVVLVVFWLA